MYHNVCQRRFHSVAVSSGLAEDKLGRLSLAAHANEAGHDPLHVLGATVLDLEGLPAVQPHQVQYLPFALDTVSILPDDPLPGCVYAEEKQHVVVVFLAVEA